MLALPCNRAFSNGDEDERYRDKHPAIATFAMQI
jgi:hypothetical protein